MLLLQIIIAGAAQGLFIIRMSFAGGEGTAKAWKDVWGCGQGIGAIKEIASASEFVARLKGEYALARERLARLPARREPAFLLGYRVSGR